MLFSIVIPAYEAFGRAEEFLNDLFQSIYSQSYKTVEVIVSDHSENDIIQLVCLSWSDKLDIKHFFNDKNRGNSSVNMNEGIKIASGDYIKIMHMDDKFCNDSALSLMYHSIIQTDKKWGALGFNHNYEGEEIPVCREIIPSMQLIGCPSVSFFVNDKTNFFDENLIVINDFDMHQRLNLKYGDPLIIEDICITIRMHKDQFSELICFTDRENKEWEYYTKKTGDGL